MKSRVVQIVVVIAGLIGCSSDVAVVNGPADIDAFVQRDTSQLVQTDSLAYNFRHTSIGLESRIGFVYRNPLPDTMYIVNCRGYIAASFQRLRGDVWETFWSPVVLACLSPPIVIPPGGALTGDAYISGSRPGGNMYPVLPLGDLTGIYRIVISPVVHHYTSTGNTFGIPVPLDRRVSNAFVLRGGFDIHTR